MAQGPRESGGSKGGKARGEKDCEKRSKIPSEKISSEDYYLKAVEFEAWLRSHDLYFDELSQEKIRKLFAKFVRRWNAGRLKPKFYDRENSIAGPSQRWTRYSWKIKGQGGASTSQDHDAEQRLRRARVQQREYIEEMFPRPTGREAALEKKRAITRYHAREVDVIPELSDSVIMTGGGQSNTDDYEALLERERARRERAAARRQADVSVRLEAYMDKERKTIEMLQKLAEAKRGGEQ